MGGVWLNGTHPDYMPIDEVIKKAGCWLDEIPGYDWKHRSRRSNSSGFPSVGPYGGVLHHTASSGASYQRDRIFCSVGHRDAPVGNLVLGPRGQMTPIAAGAANTQGKGGPTRTSRGVVPLNEGNGHYFAVEACNNGIGEPWPKEQIDAYIAFYAMASYEWGWNPMTDLISHFEWCEPSCPGRKCDPAGPCVDPAHANWTRLPVGGCHNGNLWLMNEVRLDINARLLSIVGGGQGPGPIPGPTPGPVPPTTEDEDVYHPYLIQCINQFGGISPVYLVDGRLMTYRHVKTEAELRRIQGFLKWKNPDPNAANLNPATPDQLADHGTLIGTPPDLANTGYAWDNVRWPRVVTA